MIQREYYTTRFDNVNLFRTFSDEGFYIRQEQTGILYEEAIDVEDSEYTYTETDLPLPIQPDAEEEEAEEADEGEQEVGIRD